MNYVAVVVAFMAGLIAGVAACITLEVLLTNMAMM